MANNLFSTTLSEPSTPTHAALDGLIEFATIGMYDEQLKYVNPYATAAAYADKKDLEIIKEYRRLWSESDLVNALVEYLVSEILAPFHFEPSDEGKGQGKDIETVKVFWDLADMDAQLEVIVREAILEGLGVGDKLKAGNELKGFQWADASLVNVEVDPKTGKETWTQDGQNIKREKLFIYRPILFPGQHRGVSFVRAALVSLQGMDDLKRDIPAAVKNLAYVTRLLKLDLSRITDPAKKKSALSNAKNLFARYASATTTVIAYDQSLGDIGYMGTIGGASGNQTRVPALMEVITPIIAFLTLRFALEQGHINQKDANSAIIEMQGRRAKRQLDRLRRQFARTLEREIIRDILGQEYVLDPKKALENEPTKVRVVYDIDPSESRKDRLTLIREYQLGVISRGVYWKLAGFPNELLPEGAGEQFIYDTPLGQSNLRGQQPTRGEDVTEPERNNKNGKLTGEEP